MDNNKVEVRLFAYLRENRGKVVFLDVKNVREVLDILNISDEDAYMTLINGRDGTKESSLSNGDILSIFPQVGGG